MREVQKFDGFAAHPSTTVRRSLGGPDGSGAGCAPPFLDQVLERVGSSNATPAWTRLDD